MVERDVKKPLCKVTAGKGLGYWRITLASDISLITALAYSDITHDSVSMYVQYSAMASLMGKKDLEKRLCYGVGQAIGTPAGLPNPTV